MDVHGIDHLYIPSCGEEAAGGGDYVLLHVGRADMDSLKAVRCRFRKELKMAQSKTGDERSSGRNNETGHQKTPAFIVAVLENVLIWAAEREFASVADDAMGNMDEENMPDKAVYEDNEEEKTEEEDDDDEGEESDEDDDDEGPEKITANHQPRGGVTDVGLHTGGLPRNTAWPLVVATLHYFASKRCGTTSAAFDPFQFAQSLIVFHLYNLSALWNAADEAAVPATPQGVVFYNRMVTILRHAGRRAAALTDKHYLIPDALLDEMKTQEQKIESRFAKDNDRASRRDVIVPTIDPSEWSHPYSMNAAEHIAHLEERSKALREHASRSFDGEAIKLQAERNSSLGPLQKFVYIDERSSFSLALSLLSGLVPTVFEEHVLALTATENYLFHHIRYPRSPPSATDAEKTALVDIVTTYMSRVTGFLKAFPESNHAIDHAHVRGQEVLVVWAALVIYDRLEVTKYDLLLEYALSVNTSDLRDVQVQHNLDVLEIVCNYIHSRSGGKAMLFNLSANNREAFFDFAIKFSTRYLKNIRDDFVVKEEERGNAYWRAVEAKRESLVRIRQNIASERAKEEAARRKENEAGYEKGQCEYGSADYEYAKRREQNAWRERRSAARNIKNYRQRERHENMLPAPEVLPLF